MGDSDASCIACGDGKVLSPVDDLTPNKFVCMLITHDTMDESVDSSCSKLASVPLAAAKSKCLPNSCRKRTGTAPFANDYAFVVDSAN